MSPYGTAFGYKHGSGRGIFIANSVPGPVPRTFEEISRSAIKSIFSLPCVPLSILGSAKEQTNSRLFKGLSRSPRSFSRGH